MERPSVVLTMAQAWVDMAKNKKKVWTFLAIAVGIAAVLFGLMLIIGQGFNNALDAANFAGTYAMIAFVVFALFFGVYGTNFGLELMGEKKKKIEPKMFGRVILATILLGLLVFVIMGAGIALMVALLKLPFLALLIYVAAIVLVVFVSKMFQFYIASVVAGDNKALAALKESKKKTKGYKWRLVGMDIIYNSLMFGMFMMALYAALGITLISAGSVASLVAMGGSTGMTPEILEILMQGTGPMTLIVSILIAVVLGFLACFFILFVHVINVRLYKTLK